MSRFSARSRRLFGWLSYAFAWYFLRVSSTESVDNAHDDSEVFGVVSLPLFLPVCLEQFARDNGFLEPDRTIPCVAITGGDTAASGASCAVKIGWIWIDTASFSLYVNSIALAIQALTVISVGNIADRGKPFNRVRNLDDDQPLLATGRKPLLLIFAFTGSTAATCFVFLRSSSPAWILCALFSICATVGYGASIVVMNSYLPFLARESPEVLEAERELDETSKFALQPLVMSGEPFHSRALSVDPDPVASTSSCRTPPSLAQDSDRRGPKQKAYARALSQATSRISARGITFGYLAGVLVLLLTLIPASRLHNTTYPLRLAIGLSGAWWMSFSIPAAVWLPGSSARAVVTEGTWSVSSEVRAAWKQFWVILRWSEVKRLQDTFRYLLAWFVLADTILTITSTAILFAKTTLHMSSTSLIIIGIITPASGVVGALVCPYLQQRFGWSNRNVLLTIVMLISLVPVYGTLGFIPYFQEKHIGGLQAPVEMFVIAVYFGFVYGAVQSYSRATFAELIPQGEEARWYGLFSITDKSGSFIGPLIVGLITDDTGSIRYGLFYLLAMIWVAVPVLLSVDFERGRANAKAYSEERVGERRSQNEIR